MLRLTEAHTSLTRLLAIALAATCLNNSFTTPAVRASKAATISEVVRCGSITNNSRVPIIGVSIVGPILFVVEGV
jgi:hypothetical protein